MSLNSNVTYPYRINKISPIIIIDYGALGVNAIADIGSVTAHHSNEKINPYTLIKDA